MKIKQQVAQFDLEVMKQLKDELGNAESYTVREFLDIYIQAINILEFKKMKEENIIVAAKDKLNELINLQEQARIAEQNGHPNNTSILYINIDQAKGLDRQSQYITRINFDQNQTTQTNPSNYSSDPQFNQEFKLRISNPNSILTFAIEDSMNGRVIGLVTLKLKQFYHQKKIDEWYILEDQGGALGDINRQVAIAIQWVHSERLLYENILRENDYFEPVIKDQEERLIDSIEMIRVLKHPFERDVEAFRQEMEETMQHEKTKKAKRGGYKRGNDNEESGKNNEEPGAVGDCWNTCLGLFDDDEEQKISVKSNNAAHAPQKTQTDIESLTSLKDHIVYIFAICSIIVCFFRPNFIDVCIALAFLSKYFELNAQNCNRFAIVLISSMFIDLLWMGLFTRNWFSYAGDSTFLMIIFIIIEVSVTIVKVVLGIVLYKLKGDDHPIQQNNQIQQTPAAITHNYQHQNY